MANHLKKFDDYSEFFKAGAALIGYQRIHKIIKEDYIELLNITEKHKLGKTEFNALFRACLKGLFSIIEADIYGLNNIDKYENYSDWDSFETKFKKTFKQICSTWNKTEIQKVYFNEKYSDLKKLKKKRDELIHPKKVEHLHESSENDFEKVKKAFIDYDSFINKIMDFFISANVVLTDLIEIKKHSS